MSLWLEPDDKKIRRSVDVVDAVFRIKCQSLPVDHAASLSIAIQQQVPWLADDEFAGVHPIHVANSQNGWDRPDAKSGENLMLSRRTRLRIRLSRSRAEQLISALENKKLNIAGNELLIESASQKTLHAAPTLFSRYVSFANVPLDANKSATLLASNETHTQSEGAGAGGQTVGSHADGSVEQNGQISENEMVEHILERCQALGFRATKILCGRDCNLLLPVSDQYVNVRSVLLEDVPAEASLLLQAHGLGELRLLGCGIVLPHKSTAAVDESG